MHFHFSYLILLQIHILCFSHIQRCSLSISNGINYIYKRVFFLLLKASFLFKIEKKQLQTILYISILSVGKFRNTFRISRIMFSYSRIFSMIQTCLLIDCNYLWHLCKRESVLSNYCSSILSYLEIT